jgi:hypothetical protein
MLHRGIDGKVLTVEELKVLIRNMDKGQPCGTEEKNKR